MIKIVFLAFKDSDTAKAEYVQKRLTEILGFKFDLAYVPESQIFSDFTIHKEIPMFDTEKKDTQKKKDNFLGELFTKEDEGDL